MRKYLSLLGPGVLNRTNCMNDEDLLTCEEKDKQNPLDYFAFEQNGKIWWFDFNTIWAWLCKNNEFVNPYNKMDVPTEAVSRLFAVYEYRRRHRMSYPEEPNTREERIQMRLRLLCNVFKTQGFVDSHVNMFNGIQRSNYIVMFRMLCTDIDHATIENKQKLKAICQHALHRMLSMPHQNAISYALHVLLHIILEQRNQYPITFMILSAMFRC